VSGRCPRSCGGSKNTVCRSWSWQLVHATRTCPMPRPRPAASRAGSQGPGPPGALALGAGQPRPILGKPTPAVPFNAVAAGFGGSALPETARPVARGPCAAAVGPSLHCAITGLPGRKSEQGFGRRHVSGLCPPDHIGPQPPMRGIHPHPDIVHDPQDPAALQSPRRSCNRPRRSRCDDRPRSCGRSRLGPRR
jgi:hypothetical protein